MTDSTTLPLLQNIRAQPEALAQVVGHQLGAGQPALTRATDAIRERGPVVFSGIGASFFASIPAISLLHGSGVPAGLVDASELLHYSHNAYGPGAVFVLVSRSGDSIEITRLLSLLKDRHAMVIGVTNEPDSQLSREADITIQIGSPTDQMVAVQTYTGTLAALHLLGAAATGQLDSACRRELDEAIEAVARAIPVWEQASRDWSAFFQGSRPTYLLARGASLASAMEGALLFHEIAKTPTIAMGAALFRHGPAEVVDEDFRGLVFAPPDCTQEINIALARDLAGLGGQVRLIGPLGDVPEAEGLACWRIYHTSRFLSPLVEVLPLQFAAYRLAEWKGITPGDFRLVEQVARSETSFTSQQ